MMERGDANDELQHPDGCWMTEAPHYHKLALVEQGIARPPRPGEVIPPVPAKLTIPQSPDPGGPVLVIGLPRPRRFPR